MLYGREGKLDKSTTLMSSFVFVVVVVNDDCLIFMGIGFGTFVPVIKSNYVTRDCLCTKYEVCAW